MKLSDVKVGDKLVADGGFMCMAEGAEYEVMGTPGDFYVWCTCGRHNLRGQTDNGELIGLAPATTPIA